MVPKALVIITPPSVEKRVLELSVITSGSPMKRPRNNQLSLSTSNSFLSSAPIINHSVRQPIPPNVLSTVAAPPRRQDTTIFFVPQRSSPPVPI